MQADAGGRLSLHPFYPIISSACAQVQEGSWFAPSSFSFLRILVLSLEAVVSRHTGSKQEVVVCMLQGFEGFESNWQ